MADRRSASGGFRPAVEAFRQTGETRGAKLPGAVVAARFAADGIDRPAASRIVAYNPERLFLATAANFLMGDRGRAGV